MMKYALKHTKNALRFNLRRFTGSLRDWRVGDLSSGFEVVSVDKFDELEARLVKFEQKDLGTIHYHIDTSDVNNTCGFLFRTPSEDDTGKSLIVEKMIQCGSERFPVRDPFFRMEGRSMCSPVSAITGPDFAVYPFSSVNKKDFYNLLDLYSESLFNPMFRRVDFLNEGWRLEFTSVTNPNTRIKLRGSAMQDARNNAIYQERVLQEEVQRKMFQDTVYQYSAAGRAQEMTGLEFEALEEYYRQKYHPSNLTLYSYGDMDPRHHQEFLMKNHFVKYSRGARDLMNLRPSHLVKPMNLVGKIPPSNQAGNSQKGSTVTMNFLCNNLDEDTMDSVGLNILGTLLFDTPESPFFVKFLLPGGVGGYCSGYGYESNIFPTYFTIGLKGVSPGTELEIKKKMVDALEEVALSGFPKDLVENVLHQVELHSRLPRKDFGLALLSSYVGAFNHNADGVLRQALDVQRTIKHIRDEVQAGRKYFEKLVRKYLLDNKQVVNYTFTVDMNFVDLVESKETKLIRGFEEKLNPAEKAQVCLDGAGLKEELEKPQTFESLPILQLADIPTEARKTRVEKEVVEGVSVSFVDRATNGTSHIRLKINLDHIDPVQAGFLHLVSRTFGKIGTFGFKFNELQDLLRKYTTGVSFDVVHEADKSNTSLTKAFCLISIGCLDRHQDKMFDLLTSLLCEPDFMDHQHLSRLIQLESSLAASRVSQDPAGYALNFAQSGRVSARQVSNMLSNVG